MALLYVNGALTGACRGAAKQRGRGNDLRVIWRADGDDAGFDQRAAQKNATETPRGKFLTYLETRPDVNFRFAPDLGPSSGYIMNLSTKGYAAGAYELTFTVVSDPTPPSLRFKVGQ